MPCPTESFTPAYNDTVNYTRMNSSAPLETLMSLLAALVEAGWEIVGTHTPYEYHVLVSNPIFPQLSTIPIGSIKCPAICQGCTTCNPLHETCCESDRGFHQLGDPCCGCTNTRCGSFLSWNTAFDGGAEHCFFDNLFYWGYLACFPCGLFYDLSTTKDDSFKNYLGSFKPDVCGGPWVSAVGDHLGTTDNYYVLLEDVPGWGGRQMEPLQMSGQDPWPYSRMGGFVLQSKPRLVTIDGVDHEYGYPIRVHLFLAGSGYPSENTPSIFNYADGHTGWAAQIAVEDFIGNHFVWYQLKSEPLNVIASKYQFCVYSDGVTDASAGTFLLVSGYYQPNPVRFFEPVGMFTMGNYLYNMNGATTAGFFGSGNYDNNGDGGLSRMSMDWPKGIGCATTVPNLASSQPGSSPIYPRLLPIGATNASLFDNSGNPILSNPYLVTPDNPVTGVNNIVGYLFDAAILSTPGTLGVADPNNPARSLFDGRYWRKVNACSRPGEINASLWLAYTVEK